MSMCDQSAAGSLHTSQLHIGTWATDMTILVMYVFVMYLWQTWLYCCCFADLFLLLAPANVLHAEFQGFPSASICFAWPAKTRTCVNTKPEFHLRKVKVNCENKLGCWISDHTDLNHWFTSGSNSVIHIWIEIILFVFLGAQMISHTNFPLAVNEVKVY